MWWCACLKGGESRDAGARKNKSQTFFDAISRRKSVSWTIYLYVCWINQVLNVIQQFLLDHKLPFLITPPLETPTSRVVGVHKPDNISQCLEFKCTFYC